MIGIDFIIIFVRLNNKRHILCYCILNYDDNRIFDLYVYYMSFIIIFTTNFESVILYHFCHNFSKHSKNYINFHLKFRSTRALEHTQFLLYTSSKNQTVKKKQGSENFGRLYNNIFLNQPDSSKLR